MLGPVDGELQHLFEYLMKSFLMVFKSVKS